MESTPVVNKRAEITLAGRRLSAGRRLLLRVSWLVAAIGTLNVYILGLSMRLHAQPTQVQTLLAPYGGGQGIAFSVVPEILIVLTFAGLATVLFWHPSDEPMVLYTSFVLLLLGPLNGYLVKSPLLLAVSHPSLDYVFQATTTLGYLMLIVFFFVFPDGKLEPIWTAWLLPLALLAVLVWGHSLGGDFDLASVNLPVLIPTFLSLIGLQIYRYNRYYSPTQRQQTKWVIFGVGTSVVALMQLIFIVNDRHTGLHSSDQVLMLLAVILVPITFSIALTRYRLFDIQFFVSRALLYALLTAVSIGGYVLIVGVISRFVSGYDTAIAVVVTGGVAAAFQPLRSWLQERVDLIFYGKRSEPYQVVRRIGEHLTVGSDLDETLTSIVEMIQEMLRLPFVAIRLDVKGSHIEVAKGQKKTAATTFALAYMDQVLGTMTVSPRAGENEMSEEDRGLLLQVARQAGLAIHNILVVEDLRSTREKLVRWREDERKLLRRDLHDDLAPTLAGLSLMVETLREQITLNPDQAIKTASALHQGLHESVRSIRDLAYDLRPPALDHLGLLGAIEGLVDRLASTGVEISFVHSESLPPLAAAIEVAAYKIVREGLSNIERHARATSIQLALNCEKDLSIRILDNGRGFDPNQPRGVGLQTMVERASEVGGQVQVESSPREGTRIDIRLPLLLETDND